MYYRSEGNSPQENDKMYRPKKVFFSRQRMVFRVIIGPFQLEIFEKSFFPEEVLCIYLFPSPQQLYHQEEIL